MSVGHAPEADPSIVSVAHPSLPRRGRVLVVDDDRVVRHLLTQMLDTEYEVGLAENGTEALRAARRLHPDVILTDLIMPDGSGWDLIVELRRDPAFEEVQIIAISGAERPPAEILDFGADDFISKPFEPDELSSRVAVAVARRYRLARLHSLLNALPVGAFMTELNGQLLVVNQPLVEMLSFPSSSHLCTHRMVDLVAASEHRELVDNAIHNGTPLDVVCALFTNRDTKVQAKLMLGPAHDDAGNVSGFAGLARLLTRD